MGRPNATNARPPSPSTAAPAIKTAKGEARRDRVLELATDLFLAKGFNGVSVDDIVRQAGGSKLSVYHHFGSKEILFEAVVLELCRDFRAQVERLRIDETSFEATFVGMARALVRMAISERQVAFYRMVIGVSSLFPEIGRIWHEQGLQPIATIIERTIAPWFSAGGVARADLPRLASALQGALVFHLLSTAVVLSERPKKKAVDGVIEAAWTLASSAQQVRQTR